MNASAIRNIILFLFLLVSLGTDLASGQCVRDDLTVNNVFGQVFAVSRDGKIEQTFPNANIVLSKRSGDGDEIVAEVLADSKGLFALENVQQGKYILRVSARLFDDIVIRLKVKNNVRSDTPRSLEIGLGVTDYSGTDSCEGYAMVVKSP